MTTPFAWWSDVVGPELAALSRPTQFRSGVLLVEVDDRVIAHQLAFLERNIVAGALAHGDLEVERLRFRHPPLDGSQNRKVVPIALARLKKQAGINRRARLSSQRWSE